MFNLDFAKHSLTITNWIYCLVKCSFIYLLFTLPIQYLILNLLVSETISEIGTLIVTMILLIPFIWAPAVVATYRIALDFFTNGRTVEENFFQRAFKSYKKNYLDAMKVGGIYIVGLFFSYLCFWYYGQFHLLGKIIPALFAILLSILFFFVLAHVCYRYERIRDYWKIPLLLVLNHPILLLTVLFECLLTIFLGNFSEALLIFVAPGVIALIISYFYVEMIHMEEKKLKNV